MQSAVRARAPQLPSGPPGGAPLLVYEPERVGDSETLALLRNQGVDFAQGFYIGPAARRGASGRRGSAAGGG
jgi:hypothetical protein